jgi:hypothetical protein
MTTTTETADTSRRGALLDGAYDLYAREVQRLRDVHRQAVEDAWAQLRAAEAAVLADYQQKCADIWEQEPGQPDKLLDEAAATIAAVTSGTSGTGTEAAR